MLVLVTDRLLLSVSDVTDYSFKQRDLADFIFTVNAAYRSG